MAGTGKLITSPPNVEQIKEALELIKDKIITTPLVYAEKLSQELGCEIYLKLENLQKTGAYKIRGAYNTLSRLSADQIAAGLVTASAGNHAQGVGYAAKALGFAENVEVFMPKGTPLVKVVNTRSYGVTPKMSDHVKYDDVSKEAHEYARTHGKTYVEAYNDWNVIAGQGTLGLEIISQLDNVKAVFVPIGGGGLSAGVATAIKSLNPAVTVVGVESACAACGLYAIRMGAPKPFPGFAKGIADGISVECIGDKTFPLLQRYVDFFVAVGEQDIIRAMEKHYTLNKQLVEGAGAVPLAALLAAQQGNEVPIFSPTQFKTEHDPDLPGSRAIERDIQGNLFKFDANKSFKLKKDDKVVLIISGGNVDSRFHSRVLDEGMRLSGRYLVVNVTMPDAPGKLLELLRVVNESKANLVDVNPHRTAYPLAIHETSLELIIEIDGKVAQKQLYGDLMAFTKKNIEFKLE